MEPILKAKGIVKVFDNKDKVLKGIDLEIEKNSYTVMLGPSGSGKSTLLNILSGLIKPTEGRVWHKEKEITAFTEKEMAEWKRSRTGNIFQNYLLLNNLTVRENIEIGINPNAEPSSLKQLAKMLEIGELLNKFPTQLSGGQQQRAAIARAVIKKPEILFCDEATGALDETNSKKVVELLHNLRKDFGITVLFVTHNLQIAETADRIITIKNGLICKDRYNQNPIAAEDMVWG